MSIKFTAVWNPMLLCNKIVPFEGFSVLGNGSHEFLRFILSFKALDMGILFTMYLGTIIKKAPACLAAKALIIKSYSIIFLKSNETSRAFTIFKLSHF